MIYAVAGSPGSFKSVHVLEKYIIPALKKGRPVYTNIEKISAIYIATYFEMNPIEVDSLLHILGREYDDDGNMLAENPDKIRRFYDDVPNNALIVIDEAQNYFGSRDFKEQYSKDAISYLTRHRHYGHDIIYITQNIDSVDITFRRNTQMTYVLKRAEAIGAPNLCFIFVYDRTDLERKWLARLKYTPNKACFKCYASYEGGDVEEHRKSYNVILRSRGFWFFIIGVALLLGMYFSGRFDRLLKPSQSVAKPVKVMSSSSASNLSFVPSYSSSYQVSPDQLCVKEWISVHGSPKFVLSDGSVVDRTSLSSCPK